MKFSTGIMVGSVLGASVALMSTTTMSKSNKKRMKKTGRKMMGKAEDVIDHLMDMV